jgi:GT2 family glycosyltransferase
LGETKVMNQQSPPAREQRKQANAQEITKYTPTVSIIVLSWNSKVLLQTCLTSIQQKTEYANYKVIVVDNGSADDSVSWVKKKFPLVDIVALDRNYGFSIGNNEGIAYAIEKFNPKYVLLLNNDIEIIQRDWLTKLVAAAESENAVGIVGSTLIYADGRIQYIGTKLYAKGLSWLKPENCPNLPEIYPVDCVLGACFLMKRSVIDKIGGLDVGFSPFGHEESDFCIRARKAGYKIYMVSTVKAVHQNRASMKTVNREYLRKIARRNSIRFMLLNFPVFWIAKRLPYEGIIRPFIVRNTTVKSRIPIKLRDNKDMLIEVKTNINSWIYNLKDLHEIFAKRQNRVMKLPLVSTER